VTFDRKRLPLAVAVAVVGVVLPFLTWEWAKAIDERLVFEERHRARTAGADREDWDPSVSVPV